MSPDFSTNAASLNSLMSTNGLDPKTTAIIMGIGVILVVVTYLSVEKKGPFK